MGSKIQWTDDTWNPIVGCSKISPGCANCYAEIKAKHSWLQRLPQYREVITGKKWNGKTCFAEMALENPLHWKQPSRIFVSSMGDLFHESVPFEWIAKVFYVMAICYWHTFLVLTKRPDRKAEFFKWVSQEQKGLWWDELGVLARHLPTNKNDGIGEPYLTYHENVKNHYHPSIPNPVTKLGDAGIFIKWPLPNVWLGVTAENQEWWDKRKEAFFSIPAAKHFVSNEPLLGNIKYTDEDLQRLDWVIVGAESGAKKRYCPYEWPLDIVTQCSKAGVPCFVKQIHDGARKLIKMPNGWPHKYPANSGEAGNGG